MVDTQKMSARFPPVEEVSDTAARNLGALDRPGRADAKDGTTPNRVKTRFLGFNFSAEPETGEPGEDCQQQDEQPEEQEPLARLVIVQGAGRGKSFALTDDFYRIGRDAGQEIQLAFGDKFVSRKNHATIAHYGDQYGFEIRDGGKANPVLLNGRKLWRNEHLKNGDLIRLGKTTLRFFDLRNGPEANARNFLTAEPHSPLQTDGYSSP